MAELRELALAERRALLRRIEEQLAERRALLRRIEEQHHLEPDDWAVMDALVSELIDQAEPGQEWVTIELSDEEDASRGEVGAEDVSSECESKRGPFRSSGPLNPRR